MRFLALASLLVWSSVAAGSDSSDLKPTVGSTFEIVRVAESEFQRGDQGNGSSYDSDAIIERVVDVRDDGLELEYDNLPPPAGKDSAGNWQFPARVFKPNSGPTLLLNAPELEARLDPWLAKAKWNRAICDKWIFTWNAFHIDCDPQSAIAIIEPFDLRPSELSEGAPYRDDRALAPVSLKQIAKSDNGSSFAAELSIDPDKVRRAQAESDVAVGTMTGQPVTLDDALRNHAADRVSGTIVVTFETDSAGEVKRRKTVTTIETIDSEGMKGTRKTTETVERERVT